jgi:hypothetical protein
LVSIPINIGAVTNEPDQRVIGYKDAKKDGTKPI